MLSSPIAVVGPTASGKSALAIQIAKSLGDCEIISADAMQLYRGMDIGTPSSHRVSKKEFPIT